MNTPAHHITRINNGQLLEIVACAESTAEECCGFLLGHDHGVRIITRVIAASNVAPGDRRMSFEIDPLEYLRAEQYAAQHGLEFLGIYHSHPDCPAVPSEADLRMAHPDLSYVIVATKAQRFAAVRSWRLNSTQQFAEETLVLADTCTPLMEIDPLTIKRHEHLTNVW